MNINFNKTNKKPIIGIPLNRERGGENEYSMFPWYGLRCNYADSIIKHGGVPIFIPYDNDSIEIYANLIDGLLIAGGAFDVPAHLYGEENHLKTEINNERSTFEYALLKIVALSDKPILGICGGHQLLNVFFGGTLIQHVPDIATIINHEQTNAKNEVSHAITIYKDTKLYSMFEETDAMVNSTHHQAVAKIGKNLKISAISPLDNIIEAIEHDSHPFCVGVQWHPEYLTTKGDNALFKEFITACVTRKNLIN